MANDGWSICKGLRKAGVDADLFIQRPSHVASLPQWEEEDDVDLENVGDLYEPNWQALQSGWDMPSWVHVYDTSVNAQQVNRRNLIKQLGDYDLVVGHYPFAVEVAHAYALTYERPYAIFDAGGIRYLYEPVDIRLSSCEIGRWAYRHAARIFFSNVDTHAMFKGIQCDQRRLVYSPLAIDTDNYQPSSSNINPKDPVFFSPSRQDWAEKGNYKLIEAFARYLQRNPRATLLLVDWGDSPKDLRDSKQLVLKLGLTKNVRWLPVCHKRRLIELYNQSTAVFDQFNFGALGAISLEAMSCKKPVVGYAKPTYWNTHQGSMPPVLNCKTSDEIFQTMIKLEDSSLRETIGKRAREWVIKTCSLEKVARLHILNYKKMLTDIRDKKHFKVKLPADFVDPQVLYDKDQFIEARINSLQNQVDFLNNS